MHPQRPRVARTVGVGTTGFLACCPECSRCSWAPKDGVWAEERPQKLGCKEARMRSRHIYKSIYSQKETSCFQND